MRRSEAEGGCNNLSNYVLFIFLSTKITREDVTPAPASNPRICQYISQVVCYYENVWGS